MKITKVYSAGIFAAAALLVSGCFNPDLTGVVFKCDDINNAQCPAGQTCLEGNCVPQDTGGMTPGGPTDDGGTGAVDMAIPGGTTTGCASGGGTDVTKSGSKLAYSCAGNFFAVGFGSPSAVGLCASGYEICTKADNIDLAKCNQDPKGFFIARVVTKRDGKQPPATGCGSPGRNESGMFAGCGGATQSVITLTQSCTGFSKAWDCGDGQLYCFNNNGYSPEATGSTRSDYGVLCCKK